MHKTSGGTEPSTPHTSLPADRLGRPGRWRPRPGRLWPAVVAAAVLSGATAIGVPGSAAVDAASVERAPEPAPVEILAVSPAVIHNDITIQITIILSGFDMAAHTVTSLSFIRGDDAIEIAPDPMTIGNRIPVTVPRLRLAPGRYDVSLEVDDGEATTSSVLTDGLTVLAPGMEVDDTPPSVTIDQATAQVDPTGTSPVEFTAVFSEAVTGFTDADVDLSGSTTDGSLMAAVTGGPEVYTVSVEVSGATTDGTVVATIPAAVAEDAFGNGNEASTSTDASVTFLAPEQIEPLVISVPAGIVVSNDPGKAGAIVDYPLPSASGGQLPVTVSCSPESGSFFVLGVTEVGCTATDAAGDSDRHRSRAAVTGSFTITVEDTEPPVVAGHADITARTAGPSTSVTFEPPEATDNSGDPPSVACTPEPGSTFPLGTTTVTCTATDAAGNTASSSFSVTVASDEPAPPQVTEPAAPAPPGSRLPATVTATPPRAATPPGSGLARTGGPSGVPPRVAAVLLLGGLALVAGAHQRRRTAGR